MKYITIIIAFFAFTASPSAVIAQEEPDSLPYKVYVPYAEDEAQRNNFVRFYNDINNNGYRDIFEFFLSGTDRMFVVQNTTGVAEVGTISKFGNASYGIDCTAYGCAIQGRTMWTGQNDVCHISAPTAIVGWTYLEIPMYYSSYCEMELPQEGN